MIQISSVVRHPQHGLGLVIDRPARQRGEPAVERALIVAYPNGAARILGLPELRVLENLESELTVSAEPNPVRCYQGEVFLRAIQKFTKYMAQS